ncbi:MAG TPA: DUF2950 domain-containing protein, partial [Paraburkholderia sp.]
MALATARAAVCMLATASALVFGATAAHAQAVYPTPDAAANALVDALATNNHEAMKR